MKTQELWKADPGHAFEVEHSFRVQVPAFTTELIQIAIGNALEVGVPDYATLSLEPNYVPPYLPSKLENVPPKYVIFTWTEAVERKKR